MVSGWQIWDLYVDKCRFSRLSIHRWVGMQCRPMKIEVDKPLLAVEEVEAEIHATDSVVRSQPGPRAVISDSHAEGFGVH